METTSGLERSSLDKPYTMFGEQTTHLKENHLTVTEDEEVPSNFHNGSSKVSWYSLHSERMGGTTDEKMVTYSFDCNNHKLVKTTLRVKVPEIRVRSEYKDKVRICWPHNLGHNIQPETSFCIANKPCPPLTLLGWM
jgi:hypothetical protein